MGLSEDRTKEFIEDVKGGMSDDQLEDKYRLGGRKLVLAKAVAKEYLAKQEADAPESKPKVNAREILADVKSGLNNDALMWKYSLTARQLQSVFRKIIGSGLATPMELSDRLSITTSQIVETFADVEKAIGPRD